MGSKIFIDANVLLDFLLKRENYNDAKQLIQQITEHKLQGFISPSTLHILGHWLTKNYNSETAKTLLLSLLADITVIGCSHQIAEAALNSKITDIEDALQYYTAIEHKMDCFISGDKQLKKSAVGSLVVYSLKEFLELIQEK